MNFEENGSCGKKKVIPQIFQSLYNFISILVHLRLAFPASKDQAVVAALVKVLKDRPVSIRIHVIDIDRIESE